MATIYQICIAGGAETWVNVDDLGITDVSRIRMVCGVDTLTLSVSSATALTDASPYFVAKTQIRLRKLVDATPTLLFLGRVAPSDRTAEGPSESYQVEIRGMWDWFDNTFMRQEWIESETSLTKPRVILFCDGAGARMTTGAQIAQCVSVARAAGCPCAAPEAGDIMAGWSPPFDEQIAISIANAVCKALANHPHAACWFDYSEAAPRFYVRTRQSLTAVSLSVSGQTGIKVRTREDLQPPAIAIAYEKENTVDGESYRQTVIDYAPTVPGEATAATQDRLAQVDVLWGVYDLQGSSRQTVSQKIKTTTFAMSHLEDKSWWKAQVPWLTSYGDADIVLDLGSVSRSGVKDLSRILAEGAIQSWMSVSTERETFSITAYLTRRVDGAIVEIKNERVSVEMLMTSASTKTYRTTTAFDSGEPIPVGLAAAMWNEWQQLHHEGSISFAEDVPACVIGPGHTLNFTDGMEAWKSMDAMVIRVSEDFKTGITAIEYGVPGWVDIDSRVAWSRACRTRRYSYSRTLRDSSADDGGGGPSDMQSIRDGQNTYEMIRRRFFDPAADVKHEMDLDSQSFAFATPADATTIRIIKPREMPVLVIDGEGALVRQTAQVLASAPYGDATAIGGGSDFPDGSANYQVPVWIITSGVGAWTPGWVRAH